MELFKGLFVFEIFLLLLGALFFIIMATVLIYKMIKNDSIKGLVIYLIIPVIMMAWPSIKKISFDGTTGTIEKETANLNRHPQDAMVKETLQKNINKIEARAAKDPSTLAIIANARLAMGDTSKARQIANSALKLNPKKKATRDFLYSIRNK